MNLLIPIPWLPKLGAYNEIFIRKRNTYQFHINECGTWTLPPYRGFQVLFEIKYLFIFNTTSGPTLHKKKN